MPGRREEFEELYRAHRGEILRAVLRLTGDRDEAEEVTQTAFLDAYVAWRRGALPRRPRPWLFAIADNVRRRRHAARRARPTPAGLDEAADVATAADAPTARELQAALAALPERQRRVVVLRELGGLSYDEIARELELTVPAVQMLLHRARRRLRTTLGPARGLTPVPPWLAAAWSRLTELGPALRGAGALGAIAIGAGVALAPSPATGKAAAPPARSPMLAAERPSHAAATPARSRHGPAPASRAGTVVVEPKAQADRVAKPEPVPVSAPGTGAQHLPSPAPAQPSRSSQPTDPAPLPVTTAVEPATKPVVQVAGSVVEPVTDAVDPLASPVLEPVTSAVAPVTDTVAPATDTVGGIAAPVAAGVQFLPVAGAEAPVATTPLPAESSGGSALPIGLPQPSSTTG